ncbi:MAG: TetR/AcrR family transcriptional regulator [Bacteroidales bacterium]|jgi:AcrR family transcriptional regulator|nr:TetR/AcrR family transcriptional regulator [Bacteroidales bacterium]MDY0143946.1 TetR/AcrR family transcriptional regulator [Bacteroidales bacterium]
MENNKDITRENIINAASLAFSKFGYKKTSLDDIAALTNVSKTGLYYYFKNKEEVFNEVIKKEAKRMQESLIDVVSQETKPIDKIIAFINERMDFLAQISNYYSALRHDLLEQLDTINKNRLEFYKIELQVLTKILEEGNFIKDFSVENVDETAKTILLILISLEIPLFGTADIKNYHNTLDRLINICLYGITPR